MPNPTLDQITGNVVLLENGNSPVSESMSRSDRDSDFSAERLQNKAIHIPIEQWRSVAAPEDSTRCSIAKIVFGSNLPYDAEGRVITASNGTSGSSSYVYNAEGRRTRKTTVAGGTVDFLYDLSGHEITQVTSAGVWARGEVYTGGRHLVTYLSSPMTYFIYADWLGTERVRSPYVPSTNETCTSLPFGDALTCTGADVSLMHFTGKEHDTETGLENFGARYDSSGMGRFMTPDWSGKPQGVPYAEFDDPQSLDLYVYVRDNPTTRTDKDGHCTPVLNQTPCTTTSTRAAFVMTPDGLQVGHVTTTTTTTVSSSLYTVTASSVTVTQTFGAQGQLLSTNGTRTTMKFDSFPDEGQGRLISATHEGVPVDPQAALKVIGNEAVGEAMSLADRPGVATAYAYTFGNDVGNHPGHYAADVVGFMVPGLVETLGISRLFEGFYTGADAMRDALYLFKESHKKDSQ